MAKRARVDVAASLSDDVLVDIFARLPVFPDLIFCAFACKRWLCLAADLANLRLLGLLPPEHGRRHLWCFSAGFFTQGSGRLCSADEPTAPREYSMNPPQFVRLHASKPPPQPPPSDVTFTSFFPNDDGLFNFAMPLASRRGLLLVRLVPAPVDHRKLHLALCDPLLGRRGTRLIPPPPVDLDAKLFVSGRDLIGYALVLPADHSKQPQPPMLTASTTFQVLFTAVHDKRLYAYSYSSASSTWSAPIDCSMASSLTMCGPRAGVVARGGTVHWLYKNKSSNTLYTLDVDATAAATTTVSLTKIPMEHMFKPLPCIAGDGRLSLVHFGDLGELELWTKQADVDGDHHWLRSELMKPTFRLFTLRNLVEPVVFAETRGAVLVRLGAALVSVDLESKEKEAVSCGGNQQWYLRCAACKGHESCKDCPYNARVLCEMDWMSYLVDVNSRLEGSSASRGKD